MSSELVAPLILAGLFMALFLFFLTALRRARKRRFDGVAEPEPLPPQEVPADAAPEEEDEEEHELEASEPPAESRASEGPSAESPTPTEQNDSQAALHRGMTKTRESFLGKLNALFTGKKTIDGAVLDELEEALLTADVGVALTMELIDELRVALDRGQLESPERVRDALKTKMMSVMVGGRPDPLAVAGANPRVILFVGVNGVGKTTTVGKIANLLSERGHSVVMAAGDTFRAAAAEQLQIWADRSGARLIRGDEGSDPASVVFNAVQNARDTQADVVLADTAGRLHTKAELMDEIHKVKRAAGKARDGAPDETWLVIDATTGQNGLQQAKEFHNTLELSGVILTKLDGTAKGGVVVAIASALGLPVQFVGVGEKASDLRTFDPEQFVDALFG